jgi:putative ABC transport system permease protein
VRALQFVDQMMRRTRVLPGVASATVARVAPMGDLPTRELIVDGNQATAFASDRLAQVNSVGADYFETLRIPILRGRSIADGDTSVAVINETMGKRFWGSGDPVGRRFRFQDSGETIEIVGVAGDCSCARLADRPMPMVYLPVFHGEVPIVNLMVRTGSETTEIAGQLRVLIESLDKSFSSAEISTLQASLTNVLQGPRIGAQLAAAFGVMATCLASGGLFGVMFYWVSRQTREIGIRMALGSQKRDVLLLIAKRAGRLIVTATAIGVALGTGLARLLRSVLFGTASLDPITVLLIAGLMATIGGFACYFPVRRAFEIDPAAALRHE